MKKVGLFTCQAYAKLAIDEQHLILPFKVAGIDLIPVIWDTPINYDAFDLLLFRSAWDYHEKTVAFEAWLEQLKTVKTPIYNPVSLIEENYNKYYLKKLQDKGFPIIPTLFFETVETIDLANILKIQEWEKGVIKPVISMSAYHTYAFDQYNCQELQKQLSSYYGNTQVIVQQFAQEITTEGEWSLVFFDKQYCMSALKKPKKGDFRVQSELGGTITYPEPSAPIIAQAKAILNHYEEPILYARMDGIIRDGQFLLMEAELIDPELYFRSGEKGQQAFLKAILQIL